MTSMNAAKVCSIVIVALALLFILGSIACAVAAMAYQRWLVYTVPDKTCPDPIKSLYCYTRSRGMFQKCLEPDVTPLDAALDKLRINKKNCFEIELGQTITTNGELLNIRRSYVGVYAAGLLCATIGLVIAVVAIILLCCSASGIRSFPILAMILGFVLLLGGLCYLVGMLIFHIMLDEEKKQLPTADKWPYGQWTAAVIAATTIKYDISYILAWVACVCAFIAGILSLLSLCCCAHVIQSTSSSTPTPAPKSRKKTTKTKTVTESSHENAAYSEPDYVVVKHAVHAEAPKPIPIEHAATLPAGNQAIRYNSDTNEDGYYYNAEVSAGNKNMYRIY